METQKKVEIEEEGKEEDGNFFPPSSSDGNFPNQEKGNRRRKETERKVFYSLPFFPGGGRGSPVCVCVH